MTKAEILSVINDRLNRSETDIDEELRSVLYDISSRGDFLLKEATRDTVATAGIDYYSVPTDFRSMTHIKIDDKEPMDKISYKKYLILSADTTSTGEPDRFAIKNKFAWLYPDPGNTYTMTMFYSIFHPNDVDDIEFDEIFRECVYEGVLAKICEKFEDDKGLSKHLPLFEAEIAKRLNDLDSPIRFVKYNE